MLTCCYKLSSLPSPAAMWLANHLNALLNFFVLRCAALHRYPKIDIWVYKIALYFARGKFHLFGFIFKSESTHCFIIIIMIIIYTYVHLLQSLSPVIAAILLMVFIWPLLQQQLQIRNEQANANLGLCDYDYVYGFGIITLKLQN